MINYSKKLFNEAKRLSDKVSDDMAYEIVLYGSITTERADKYSDIEMDFINDKIPSRVKINNWIKSIGGQKIKINENFEDDGALCSSFIYEKYDIEIAWQTYHNLELMLKKIYSLNTTNHNFFVYVWSLNTAKILKYNGEIIRQIHKIKVYPKGLSSKLINFILTNSIKNPISQISSIKREEFFNLSLKISNDTKDLLRLLYAINSLWEPYWKWAISNVDNLNIKPQKLSLKINAIYFKTK